MRRTAHWLGCLALLVTAGVGAGENEPETVVAVPEWIHGEMDLDSLTDQVVVLYFWDVNDTESRRSIFHLNDLVFLTKGQPIRYIAVANQPMIRDGQPAGWPTVTASLVVDRGGVLSKRYGTDSAPEVVILDRDGGIAVEADTLAVVSVETLGQVVNGEPIRMGWWEDRTWMVLEPGLDVGEDGSVPERRILRETRHPDVHTYPWRLADRATYINFPLWEIIPWALEVDSMLVDWRVQCPTGHYDLIVAAHDGPHRMREQIVDALATELGLSLSFEQQERDVIVLEPSPAGATELCLDGGAVRALLEDGGDLEGSQRMFILRGLIEKEEQLPVLDHTGVELLLDFTTRYPPTVLNTQKQLKKRYGLILKKQRREVQVLVIE